MYELSKAKQKDLLKRINISPYIHIIPHTTQSLLEMVEINHKLEKMLWESVKIPPEIMYALRLHVNHKPAVMKTLKAHFMLH